MPDGKASVMSSSCSAGWEAAAALVEAAGGALVGAEAVWRGGASAQPHKSAPAQAREKADGQIFMR